MLETFHARTRPRRQFLSHLISVTLFNLFSFTRFFPVCMILLFAHETNQTVVNILVDSLMQIFFWENLNHFSSRRKKSIKSVALVMCACLHLKNKSWKQQSTKCYFIFCHIWFLLSLFVSYTAFVMISVKTPNASCLSVCLFSYLDIRHASKKHYFWVFLQQNLIYRDKRICQHLYLLNQLNDLYLHSE